jgi:hypothetical protein
LEEEGRGGGKIDGEGREKEEKRKLARKIDKIP